MSRGFDDSFPLVSELRRSILSEETKREGGYTGFRNPSERPNMRRSSGGEGDCGR